LWFKVRQEGALRASRLALAREFCAKEEDGKGIPLEFRGGGYNT